MKLIGSTKNKRTKYKNDENASCLETTKVFYSIAILTMMIISKIHHVGFRQTWKTWKNRLF